MTNPNPNSTLTPLYIGQSFTGAWQSTGTSVGISANLNTDSLSLLTIQQSNFSNGAFIDNEQTSSYQPGVAETYQMPVVLKYFRVILQNADIIDQTFCRLNTVLVSSISHDIDIRKLSAFADADNVEIIAKDGTGTLRHVLCDANGALVTTPSAVAQDVNIVSSVILTETNSADIKTSTVSIDEKMIRQTATRPVYLMSIGTFYRVATVGNTIGAVWNAIGAIVGGESLPEIGRLFKCLSVPGNIAGQGTVYDVEYTDTPIVSGSVLTTEKVSQVGSRGNLQVATFNPLAQTNIFNCTGYAEATLTYEDTSPANTGDMLIFVRVNNVADTQVCIGKLIPVVNANGTNRYASTVLNLRAFNFIYVQNNSTTDTNTNSVVSLFSY